MQENIRNILLAIAALVFAASVSVLGESSLVKRAPTAPAVATSSLEAVANPDGLAAPTAPAPTLQAATTAPSLPEAGGAAALPQSAPAATVSAPVAASAAGTTLLKDSVVNIICSSSGGSLRSISGSGVVIDGRGLILTAAHIAQYLLLEDYPRKGSSTCTIRTGSPARDAYTAELAYISPDWIRENAKTLTETAPTGTGQDDFAVLAITGSITESPLPSRFAFVPLSRTTPREGDAATVGAYAAEFLTGKQVRRSLYPTIAAVSIQDRYTFKEDTVDLIALGGSAAAQEGSSGGAVVNASGQLIGVISTSTTDPKLATRDLHAITIGHTRRSFATDTDTTFDEYLAGHTPIELVSLFEIEAKSLSKVLIKAID